MGSLLKVICLPCQTNEPSRRSSAEGFPEYHKFSVSTIMERHMKFTVTLNASYLRLQELENSSPLMVHNLLKLQLRRPVT